MGSPITHKVDGKYIREWLILGPFFPDDLDTDFLADAGGEANIEPKEGDTVTTAHGGILTWERYESKEDIVNLLDAVGDYEYATAYAYCILQNEEAGDAEIRLRSDDGVAVWINDEKAHRFSGNRSLTLGEDVFEVNLKAGENRCLIKVSNVTRDWAFAIWMSAPPPNRAVISGLITDEAGKPIPNAYVCLRRDGEEMKQTWTDASGRYQLELHGIGGKYDLFATACESYAETAVGIAFDFGELGDQRLGIQLNDGEHRAIDLMLRDSVSMEGTLLMLDDTTPHIAVTVQAIRDGKVIDATFSDEGGKYRFVNLKPGRYQVRCKIINGHVYYERDGRGRKWSYEEVMSGNEQTNGGNEVAAYSSLGDFLEVKPGGTLRNIDFRFAPFKKGVWRHYGPLDGLAHDTVCKIYVDPDGVMWLGTDGGGISKYDGNEFVNLTPKDGLVNPHVHAIHKSPDGVMWFGTWGDGVVRYDGRSMGDFPHFVNFTKEKDGLLGNNINSGYCDPKGVMWFGIYGDGFGIFRYDGREFVNFTREKDGILRGIWYIYGHLDGTVWFQTWNNGVFRYDGKQFINFTTSEGLREILEGEQKLKHPVSEGNSSPGGSPSHDIICASLQDGVCLYDGEEFVTITRKDGLPVGRLMSFQRDADGITWLGIWGVGGVGIRGCGISRYDGVNIVNFTKEDGLPSSSIQDIYVDRDGAVWIASGAPLVSTFARGGLSRYDDRSFINFTTEDGLPDNGVKAIQANINGVMWLGTKNGPSCYKGKEFVTFSADEEEGLASIHIDVMHCDANGMMWFGTSEYIFQARGVYRYDGEKFETITEIFTAEAGWRTNKVQAIHSSADGEVWIVTKEGNIFRYDGEAFHKFDADRILGDISINTLYCAPDGVVWFGTEESGIYRYHEKTGKVVNFTKEKDGLADNDISAICSDSEGGMWFATDCTGVSYYNGKEFANLTTDDGLASDIVRAIYCDSDGTVWFGTDQMGVSGYDGNTWTILDTRDGLAGSHVASIYQDAEGYLWFGTQDGLTRYCPGKSRPVVRLVSITTDRTYIDLDDIPAFHPDTRVTIEYSAIDFKTIPEKRQYRCRVKEIDSDWRKPTRETSYDFIFDEPGIYTFEVQAIDRDLNYSGPASVRLEVVPDPRNHRIIQLEAHIREQELAELERVHQELEDARQIQQSLLPESPPQVEDFEIADISIPAREVSGDFYSYLSLGDNTGIVLADVTGKSVKAAMVAAMTNGMLNEAIKAQRERWDSPKKILKELNAGLQPHLIRGMYTAMSLGILQPVEKRLIVSNAGMPYPIVKRGNKVWELEVNGLPLGLVSGVEYEDLSIDLESGDLVVFCSDGVIEATNEADKMYQTERLLELVKEADSSISAQEMVDLIVRDVTEFTGGVELSDDITIVILHCKKRFGTEKR